MASELVEQQVVWPENHISEEDWSAQDLPTMLATRPVASINPADLTGTPNFLPRMPRLILMDGTSLSVQAARYFYCTPCDNIGPYTAVEVGYPSARPPELWKEYCADWKDPCATVYDRVPIELVLFYIAARGGIDRKKTFANYHFCFR